MSHSQPVAMWVLLGLIAIAPTVEADSPPIAARVVNVQKIWDQAPHNAFTDLTRWQDKWYCAFREGKGHAGDIGKLRILSSEDGTKWQSDGLLAMDEYDLRDAALEVTPNDRLMVLGGAQRNVGGTRKTGTFVSFAAEPGDYTEPEIVVPLGRWLWRVTWHQGKAYGVSYGTPDGQPYSSLHVTQDGRKFETIAEKMLEEDGWPTEARVRFADDGAAYCLHRRDKGNHHAFLGTSKPPYDSWTWDDLGMYFGGPNFVRIPSGHWIGAGRQHTDDGSRTTITYIDPDAGTMTPLVDLPSGGDTSYPGMVWHDGQLWVSYYASHEGKTNIYLARLEFDEASSQSGRKSDVVEIGSRREIFVDDHVIDRLDGASLDAHHPIEGESVLKFDLPWEGRFSGYVTVIKDGDLYRLYYRGLPVAGADGSADEATCYAESKDGLHWTKPEFDFYPTDDGKPTNRILANAAPNTHNFSPFLDANPDADPSQRFKALGGVAKSGLFGYVSADGVRWKRLRDEPVFNVPGWVFDSQNVSFWSAAEQQYVLYYRAVPDGVRAVARATSKDFVSWSAPEMMTYSDTNSSKPSQHLYTTQTHPYFRAPHIYISTAARFMPGRRVLSEKQAEEIGVHPGYFGDTSDSVLMSTRGGQRYDRTFLSALIRPGIGAQNWVSRTNYPALNIVPTSEHEMSLYVNQNYGQETSHLRRYVFRTDGLASLHGPYEGGEMVTKPLTFRGNRLTVNFATSAAGSIWVEFQDAAGQPIEGFTKDDCDTVIGNEISRAVTWNGSTDVSSLAGKPVRLRVVLEDADLFSYQFN